MPNFVSISCLGTMGRFGNQLFQYAAARKFAQLSNSVLLTPEWVGERLFENVSHPRPRNLHRYPSDVIPWGRTNLDLYGYFQFDESVSRLSRRELREWFKFKNEWTERFPKKRPFYVAAHLRRGDYTTQHAVHYCTVTEKSYIDACKTYGISEADVIWVREDAPEIDPELESKGLGYLPDFFTLLNADIILRANSTFSWWAGVLGNAKTYSPIVGSLVGSHDVPFVEGNWPQMVDVANVGGKSNGDLHLPE